MPRKSRTITDVVRDMMTSLPESEEFISHGLPTYRVRGKSFGVYSINHHGDGRVALNLIAPAGAQSFYTKIEPEAYFVPAYVGSKGWLGIELNKGLEWSTVLEHVHEAFQMVAPPALVKEIDRNYRIKPPSRNFRPEEIDPFQGKKGKSALQKLSAICDALPETVQATQFGAPVWKAGKKTFVCAHYGTGRMQLSVWVGAARQKTLTRDKRFRIAPYTGHNGWVDLDIEDKEDWQEIELLVLESYRHFALKRMLKSLDTP